MILEKMTQGQRDEIDRLISIYLSGITSGNRDAGWSGETILARLIQFRGQLPEQTGNDQSNLSMIIAIESLRSGHFEFAKISTAMDWTIKHKFDEALAICAKTYYNGLMPNEDRAYRDEDRARLTGLGLSGYKYNLKKAYYTIQAEIDRLDSFLRVLQTA